MSGNVLAVVGIALVVFGLFGRIRSQSSSARHLRTGFVRGRSSWSPMHWPHGRSAWRSEFGLWFKIAAYSATAGAIFTFVVTH